MIAHARRIKWCVLILAATLMGCGMRLTREKEQLPGGYVLFFFGGVDDVSICDEVDNSVIVPPQIPAIAVLEPFVVGRRVNSPYHEPKPEYFVLDTRTRKLNWFTDQNSMNQYFNLRGVTTAFEMAPAREEARRWQASR